ncbi:MAG: tryptophan--tRNA ligase [Elusimicrobia bacterium CG1_02_37_114]|nr:MAG: tryptophan--tRNA ligase [Elusimicrobia bacterium CG1_02_37_114]PIV54138.1 MAG: tryptophan--tRNA ligase [Elusimicrobia bacterium CG02_land_8_20_14_3_00_37_13]
MSKKGRILSGMRPTDKLHIGNLIGALNNWVRLQDEYECFYMVADWHALTTHYADTKELQNNIREMVVDWLAVGLDPDKSVLFRQSDVVEHSELHLLLSMVVPVSWLERCPTYKEQMQEVKDKDISTYGFLGYPVLQSADILIYKANVVPVGEDQLPHLELCREITRRFNNFYGSIFPEPQALLSESARVPGIDGRKMSKSYSNAIYLSDSESVVDKKIQQMFTDPKKIRVDDTGHTDECVVFAFNKIFFENCQEIEKECHSGKIGCVKCKKELSKRVNSVLNPVREKREKILKEKDLIEKVLKTGRERASAVAGKTMDEVRKAIRIS